jgi:hypothetical protein
MTTVINTISNKFSNLTTLMSKNVSILHQFYINKKINNIYNTNLNDIISNITNNIIEINTLLKISSFFEYYPLISPRIDDLRTFINKVIISIFISILEEKVINYRTIATMPGGGGGGVNSGGGSGGGGGGGSGGSGGSASIYDLTTPYNKNKNIQFIINNNFKLQSINVLTFEGNSLDMENLYYINFVFRYITFKINRVINMFNFIIKTYY